MNFEPEDEVFLKDLVKGSRQRTHQVQWVDRDGTQRVTVLNQTEIVRLKTIAQRERVSASEILRQAAFIPVNKPAPKETPPAA
jgi:hypothetical protein